MDPESADGLDSWTHGLSITCSAMVALMAVVLIVDIIARRTYRAYQTLSEMFKLRVMIKLTLLATVFLALLGFLQSVEINRLGSVYGGLSGAPSPSLQQREYPWSVSHMNFSAHCQTNFNLTGNGPHERAFVPRILWALCLDDYEILDFSALDIGLCYGDDHGKLVEQAGGFFNTSCLDCNREPGATTPTLFCHCETANPRNASEIHKYLYTSTELDQTIQVHNGILGCVGGNGTRGGEPPEGIGY